MKKNVLLAFAACSAMLTTALSASAQDETVVVVDQTVAVTEIPCQTHYYSNAGDNWFLQFGAGMNLPVVEDKIEKGSTDSRSHFTANYSVGFGKWLNPYVALRLSFNGGVMHWENNQFQSANMVNGNFDVMWDMFNSFGGVNSHRVFSIVPFVGLGGTFVWDYRPNEGNIINANGEVKRNEWVLPVSAGLQMRFRLSKYVNFFVEGRAGFYGDNFNNYAYGKPVDIDVTAIGGFTINFGGSDFKSYNPCDYVGYINTLNNQVNDLRGALATTAAALAVAESQLPCPEVTTVTETVVVNPTPLMASVRFRINSARIQPEEMVNIYNVAKWMQENPDQNVTITGYADKDTGTSAYNMTLSQRRAQAVNDVLVNTYGINPDRLSIAAYGSDVQPYDTNNWNRIVIFNVAE